MSRSRGFNFTVFDNTECLDSNDIKINQKEFVFIVEIDASERLKKLNELRENNKNQVLSSETKEIEDITDEKKKVEIAQTQKKKKLAIQKEIELKKLKKSEKIKKRKEELEKKRLARKAEQEKKKKERLAKIEKRKKEQEKKRLARKAEQDRLKKERLVKIEQKKKLDKIKKEIANKNKNAIKLDIKQNEKVNENLKVIFVDSEIVKSETLPTINNSENIDYEINKDFSLEILKNFLANNSNLVIIIPKDFDTFSNVVSEENLTSKMVAGTRSVPNPEFNRLQAEMRRTERELQRARQKQRVFKANA